MATIFDPDMLASTVRISTPILIAAMGGLICMRAAVFNIGLEGFMLIGAFFAIYVAELVGSVVAGFLGAMIAGMILSLIYGLAVIRYKVDVIIAGIAINLMALGMTAFFLRTLFGSSGVFRPSTLEPLPVLRIPIIEEIPLLGPFISGHTPLVYAGFCLVVITYIVLYRTPFGLVVRTVGEAPEAARTAGLDPDRAKMMAILWSGALCGLAGAHLSTGYVFEFSENMVQGRGFAAFTAIVFGAEHPIWTSLACLIFAFADAFGIRLQLEAIGLPPSIVKMFPYVFAIIVLTVGSAMRRRKMAYGGD